MGWRSFFARNYARLKEIGIDFQSVNCVRFVGWESFEHRLLKFILCHNIYEVNHNFKTEQAVNGSVCDVIDLDTMRIYEVETSSTRRRVDVKPKAFDHPLIEDVLIVDVRKLDFDWRPIKELCKRIREAYGIVHRIRGI